MDQNMPFVGRHDELARLDHLDLGAGGSHVGPHGFLLVGRPGIGKTRLMDQFLSRSRAGGTCIRMVAATKSVSRVPLGCLTDVLTARLTDRHSPVQPDALFHEAVAALIGEATGSRSWLLAVDDLTAVDEVSAGAIHQCLSATGVSFVATARIGDDWPEAFDALWRDGAMELLPVEPLADTDIGCLIDSMAGDGLDERSRSRLVRLAAGNPLVARELLASLRDTGGLLSEGAVRASADGSPTERQVSTLVEQHLAKLDTTCRRAVEQVALRDPPTSGTAGCAAGGDPSAAQVSIRRVGRCWMVSDGRADVAVRDLAGLGYLAKLLAHPGRDLRASWLADGVDVVGGTRQPVLDAAARHAIESRAHDLVDQLGRARHRHDQGTVDRLEREAEAIADELRRCRGTNGASRGFADRDERARTSVRKAITRALDELASVHAPVAAYLRPRVTTGTTCSFRP